MIPPFPDNLCLLNFFNIIQTRGLSILLILSKNQLLALLLFILLFFKFSVSLISTWIFKISFLLLMLGLLHSSFYYSFLWWKFRWTVNLFSFLSIKALYFPLSRTLGASHIFENWQVCIQWKTWNISFVFPYLTYMLFLSMLLILNFLAFAKNNNILLLIIILLFLLEISSKIFLLDITISYCY